MPAVRLLGELPLMEKAVVDVNSAKKFMTMDTHDEGKNEKAFKTFGKRVDDFLGELHDASERLQKEFEERFEELKQTAERLKEEAENRERWKEVEGSLKKAGDELANAFKTAFKKKG